MKIFGYEIKKVKPFSGFLKWIGGQIVWSDTNRENNVRAYMENAGVYSIVSYIAETCASSPFAVYKVKNAKKAKQYKAWTGRRATPESIVKALTIKEEAFELDDSHPMNKLLEKPNEWQSQGAFVANSVGYRLITGERFLIITRLSMGANEGLPYAIYNLPPQYMNVESDGTLFGIKGYELNASSGWVQKFDKTEVIYNRKWTPDFGTHGQQLRGLSPLKAACKIVDRYKIAVESSVSMLHNQGAAGMVFPKGEIDPENVDQQGLKYKLNTEVLGHDNKGKIAVANMEMGYVNFALSAKDLSVEELERLSMETLCNIYHIPPGIFSVSSQTENNSTEFKKQFITMACVPELVALRDDYNQLSSLYGDDVYIDFDLSVYPELQEDMAKTAQMLSTAWWFTGNEKRLRMGEDEDASNEMMNTYLVPSGMVKIDDLDTDQLDAALNREIQQTSGGGIPDNNQRQK